MRCRTIYIYVAEQSHIYACVVLQSHIYDICFFLFLLWLAPLPPTSKDMQREVAPGSNSNHGFFFRQDFLLQVAILVVGFCLLSFSAPASNSNPKHASGSFREYSD